MLQGAQRRSTRRLALPAMVCQLDARDIQLIATDVDGTLLNHKQELTERTARAFQIAASLGIKVRCSLLASTRACRLREVTKYITVVQGTTGSQVSAGHQVVVATGKAKGPWAEILPRMGPPVAGVFTQVRRGLCHNCWTHMQWAHGYMCPQDPSQDRAGTCAARAQVLSSLT